MKNFKTILALLVMSFLSQPSFATQDLIKTDLNQVYNDNSPIIKGERVQLFSGLYEIGPNNGRSSYYLLLETDINDPERFIGLLFPKGLVDKNFKGANRGRGWVLMSYPMEQTGQVMLSTIDINSGFLVDSAELASHAPHIIISKQTGKKRYPFVVSFNNMGVSNVHLGMKGSRRSQPQFNYEPSQGLFGKNRVLVSNGVISLNDGVYNNSYTMTPFNGTTQLGVLKAAETDTMSRGWISSDPLAPPQHLGFFITGCWSKELFFLASPAGNDYQLTVYSEDEEGFFGNLFMSPGPEKPEPNSGFFNNFFKL